jgi:uncharacterized membrane protein
MLKSLKGYLVTGILVLIPFVATAFVFVKTFLFFDGWIRYFGIQTPGVGLAVLLAVLILTGLLVHNYLGRKIHQVAEWAMLRVPILSVVYSTVKEVSKTVLKSDRSAFQAVVMLEFPKVDCWTIGFVTGNPPPAMTVENGLNWQSDRFKLIYVMQAFSPAAGYLTMVHEDKIIPLKMSVEEGIKLVLTAGMVKKGIKTSPLLPSASSADTV